MGANASSQTQRFEQTLSTKLTNSQFSSATCIGIQNNTITVGGDLNMSNCTIANSTDCWTVTSNDMDALMDTFQSTLNEMALEQENKGINLGQVNINEQNNDTIATTLQDMRNTCSTVSETWQSQNNAINVMRNANFDNCVIRNQMQGHAEASCVMKAVVTALQEGETSMTASQKNIGLSLLELAIIFLFIIGSPLIAGFMTSRMFGKELVPYVMIGLIVGVVFSVKVYKHVHISWPNFPDPTKLDINLQFGKLIQCALLGALAGAAIKLVFFRGEASQNPKEVRDGVPHWPTQTVGQGIQGEPFFDRLWVPPRRENFHRGFRQAYDRRVRYDPPLSRRSFGQGWMQANSTRNDFADM